MSGLTGFDNIVRQGEPLAPYTWFKIGGPAAYFAEPRTIDELGELVRRCREEELPIRLIGGGSNILVRDEGVPGVVIRLSSEAFAEVKVSGETVTSGGGVKLGHLVSIAVREGLSGLESLVGIPGTVGGALHGNSGGRGGDIGQWASRATVMTRDGEMHTRERDDLVFSYRDSSLDELVILDAQFQLEPTDSAELTKRMQKQWILKKASQPPRHERRHVDRSGRVERHDNWRCHDQRTARQLYPDLTRCQQPRCVEVDRFDNRADLRAPWCRTRNGNRGLVTHPAADRNTSSRKAANR